MHDLLFAIISVLTTGGNYSPVTQANIQQAINASVCGDEVQIEAGTVTVLASAITMNKDCAPGNEVTLTTTKKAWLPDHDSKIMPSYAPLLPMLYAKNNVQALIAAPLIDVNTANGPTKGIIIRGVALKNDPFDYTRGDVSYAVQMLKLGQDDVCHIDTTFAQNLTAEHVLFLASDYTYAGSVGGLANMAGRTIRLLNSWSDDARGFQMGSADSMGVMSRNGGNDYQIINNHFGSSFAEHIIMGVGGPLCQFGLQIPTGILIEHNHFYNSMKWFPPRWVPPGPAQNQLVGWMKNFVECKSCQDMIVRWNQGENQWAGNGGGQWHAVVLTPRGSRDQSGCAGPVYRAGIAAVLSNGGATVTMSYLNTTDNTYHGCTEAAGPDHCVYSYPPGWAPGGGINVNWDPAPDCPYNDSYGAGCTGKRNWEATSIATVTDQFHFTVSPPLTSVADMGYGPGVGLGWDINNGPFKKALNVHVMGNYWKSVASDINIALRDTACRGSQDSEASATTGGNIQYVNNLHVDSEPDFLYCCGMNTNPLKHIDVHGDMGYRGDNLEFSHNTRYLMPGTSSNIPPELQCCDPYTSKLMYFDNFGRLYQTGDLHMLLDNGAPNTFGGMKYNNNINQPTGGGTAPVNWKDTVSDSTASQFLYNPANGGYAFPDFYFNCPYGNRQCANPDTFFDYQNYAVDLKFENQNKNRFKPKPDSFLHNTGSDARDVGADMRNVTAIQDLTVTPTDVAAWVRFNLTGPICHLPAQIEVSADSTLNSDLGPFTVVNAINPTMFMRADSDRVNPRATPAGCSRMFMVGDNVSVTDDNTLSRDLRLTPNTKYYYRLSVGGAQERGEFTTTAPVTSVPASWPLPTKTPTTHYKLQSGPNRTALVTGAATPCGPSGCTITLTPDANSRQFVYYILGCNSAGVVSNTWGPYFQFITR